MQTFFINKDSILPYLEMKLIENGRVGSKDHEDFFLNLQNAQLFFTMTDIDTGVVKVAHQQANILENMDCPGTFNICYYWKPRDTMRPGRYRGQFEIIFSKDGSPEFAGRNLIVPIIDELIIEVNEGIIKK